MQTILNHKFFIPFIVLLSCHVSNAAEIPHPKVSDLEELLGQPTPSKIRNVIWQTSEPPKSNLWIYEVLPPKFDENRLKILAQTFNVKGEIKPAPTGMDFSGFWIKELNPTNAHSWRSIAWSQTGLLTYDSGDDGFRWDLKNHQPLMKYVPTHQEAIQKALELLPTLGLATNNLELNSDGSLRRQFNNNTIGYNERGSHEHRKAIEKRSITFFQRVPNGGSTISIGEGGALQIGFISDGKVVDMELFFRDLKPAGLAKSISSKQLVSALENGKTWTFHATTPETLTVTNCELTYPQGNSSYQQKYVWPIYAITGFGVTDNETNKFSFFTPLDW